MLFRSLLLPLLLALGESAEGEKKWVVDENVPFCTYSTCVDVRECTCEDSECTEFGDNSTATVAGVYRYGVPTSSGHLEGYQSHVCACNHDGSSGTDSFNNGTKYDFITGADSICLVPPLVGNLPDDSEESCLDLGLDLGNDVEAVNSCSDLCRKELFKGSVFEGVKEGFGVDISNEVLCECKFGNVTIEGCARGYRSDGSDFGTGLSPFNVAVVVAVLWKY